MGLVIDTGLLLAGHRQAQNVADAAALAAALGKFRGASDASATVTANKFVQDYNGLSGSPTLVLNGGNANAVNIPPIQGPHAGNSQYVEVILTVPVQTLFIQVLGINPNQTAVGRAVAGYEPVGSGEGAIVLDPRGSVNQPGLSVQGGAILKVNGTVVINSPKAGYDQYGAWVDWGYQQYAVTTGSGSTIQAQYIQVRGGVDIPANYQNIDPNGDNPLFCRAGVAPDPLSALPIPVVTGTAQAPVSVNGGTKVFSPGIYQDIFISNNSTVTFNPGIYIMSHTQNNQGLRQQRALLFHRKRLCERRPR